MNSIEQNIRKFTGRSCLPNWLAERIHSKCKLLKHRYGINYDATVLSLISNPDLYLQLEDLPNLSSFFHRHIDIWLNECEKYDIIFSKIDNNWIPAARKPYTIALYNSQSDQVESWARLDSDSKRRPEHYKTSRNPEKSRFNGGLKFIRPIEFAAYNEGIGVLESRDKLKMYLGFTEPIGRSPSGVDQSYICLECTRVSRRQQTRAKDPLKVYGYKVCIHGYPVGSVDIANDFRRIEVDQGHIPIISLNSLTS